VSKFEKWGDGSVWKVIKYQRKEVEVMRTTIKKVGKRAGVLLLALLVGISSPLLILAAAITAFRQSYVEWRILRGGLLAGNLACSLDSDCPPGYQCIDGKCLPVTRSRR